MDGRAGHYPRGRITPPCVRKTGCGTRPSDAFVAIQYNGYWFSVTNTDIESKRGFNLLVYGFRLLAPERAAVAPALTLPTGP